MSETSETPIKTLGKYQIRGELGKGAMGVVYRGYDPALDREVAIKVMGGATVSDPDLKKRFEKEAKASAKAQHPNIVTVYDFGYDEKGAPYMAMELLKGQDLEQRIRRNPLTFREKLDVLAQTCRGLAHAHRNDVVHRDIKPANIFIVDGGEAKIMDFGVAHLQQSSQTQTGTVLGTADYMSPEQIRSAKVDGRSDIFSAGVILYRLLTNKKPFSGENIQAVFFKVLNQEPPELVLPDGNEMPELQAIVDKALSKTADERYASADDLADDLSDLIHLYHEVLNEDTVFDTMFDPAATPDMDSGTGSDGSGRRRTSSSSTGRVLGATSSGIAHAPPGDVVPDDRGGPHGPNDARRQDRDRSHYRLRTHAHDARNASRYGDGYARRRRYPDAGVGWMGQVRCRHRSAHRNRWRRLLVHATKRGERRDGRCERSAAADDRRGRTARTRPKIARGGTAITGAAGRRRDSLCRAAKR